MAILEDIESINAIGGCGQQICSSGDGIVHQYLSEIHNSSIFNVNLISKRSQEVPRI